MTARAYALLLATTVTAAGCNAQTYQISRGELARLSMVPPESRGERVRVTEQMHTIAAPAATRVETNDVIIIPNVEISAGVRTGGSGGGGGGHLGGAGADGKGAAIAFLVIAATAMVVAAGIEGSRFDGWVRLHPMHPVHLYGVDGSYAVAPLAAIDPSVLAWVDRAYVRSTEGPWLELEGAPLSRRGFTYSMYGGAATTTSITGAKGLGTAFTVQGGYFPTQEIGVQATVMLGWRENAVAETLYDSRYTLELVAMPVHAGLFHAGFYVGGGVAYRYEDGYKGGNRNPGSSVLDGGAQLQLELRTRIALTARFGLARAHDERSSDVMIGLSVY